MELEIVESIPRSSSLSLSFSLPLRLFDRDTQECRHLFAPYSHFSSLIRNPRLSVGRESASWDVLRDKAIRGNFSGGQVSEKVNRKIERERSNIPQRGQRDVKRYAKRVRVPQLSEKYLWKILGAVLSRERFWCSVILTLSLLRISLGFAPLKGRRVTYFRNERKVILTTLLKLRECSFLLDGWISWWICRNFDFHVAKNNITYEK